MIYLIRVKKYVFLINSEFNINENNEVFLYAFLFYIWLDYLEKFFMLRSPCFKLYWSVGRSVALSLVRRLFLYRKAISEKLFLEKYFHRDGSYRYAILSTLPQLIYIESRNVLPILSFVSCARLHLPHHVSRLATSWPICSTKIARFLPLDCSSMKTVLKVSNTFVPRLITDSINTNSLRRLSFSFSFLFLLLHNNVFHSFS